MKIKFKLIIFLFIIYQIIINFILIFISDSVIITFNNEEFNKILNENTLYGFPKSDFIIAVKWSGLKKTEKITIYNGHNTYKLREREIGNEIGYYISKHANIASYVTGFNVIIISIFVIWFVIDKRH